MYYYCYYHRPPRRKDVVNGASVQVQCCFTSTETIRTIRDREPSGTATSTFTQLNVHIDPTDYYYFRDGEPRTVTSTFTQLNVHMDPTNYCYFSDGEPRTSTFHSHGS